MTSPDSAVTPVVISDLTEREISYPDKVIVPVVISDLDIVRGAEFYRYSMYCLCITMFYKVTTLDDP